MHVKIIKLKEIFILGREKKPKKKKNKKSQIYETHKKD